MEVETPYFWISAVIAGGFFGVGLIIYLGQIVVKILAEKSIDRKADGYYYASTPLSWIAWGCFLFSATAIVSLAGFHNVIQIFDETSNGVVNGFSPNDVYYVGVGLLTYCLFRALMYYVAMGLEESNLYQWGIIVWSVFLFLLVRASSVSVVLFASITGFGIVVAIIVNTVRLNRFELLPKVAGAGKQFQLLQFLPFAIFTLHIVVIWTFAILTSPQVRPFGGVGFFVVQLIFAFGLSSFALIFAALIAITMPFRVPRGGNYDLLYHPKDSAQAFFEKMLYQKAKSAANAA
jgi:hypothetical protein